jgi:hypothetical protein
VHGDGNLEAEPLTDQNQESERRRRWTAFWPWPAMVAVSTALAACGSNSVSSTLSVARSTSASSEIATPVTTPQSAPAGTQTKHQSPPSGRVLAQINVVCTAVLHGFPASPTRPFTSTKLIRFANAAEAPARRTAISLARLQSLGDAGPLASLDTAWQQLEALYGSIGTLTRNGQATASLGQQILTRQQELSTLAQSDRLPACMVTGR